MTTLLNRATDFGLGVLAAGLTVYLLYGLLLLLF